MEIEENGGKKSDYNSGLTESSELDIVQLSKDEYDALINEHNKLIHAYDQLTTKTRRSFWSEALDKPEGTEPLKDFIKEISTEIMNSWDKLQRGQLKYSFYHTLTTTLFLGAILLVAYQLTAKGNLDSGSITFLLGTITGHYITLHILPGVSLIDA